MTARHAEGLSQLETAPPKPNNFEQSPTSASVSEFSIANAVNLRGKCRLILKVIAAIEIS